MDTMDNNQNRRTGKKSKQSHSERRKFLKKVAYSTPKLMVLGYLARPDDAKASKFGSTPEPPTW